MSLAHERNRHCLNLLRKKLKFSPIVSIQGPRQCGKSYLVRNILTKYEKKSIYKTLDLSENRKFASANPNTFLTLEEGKPLIIDEVQKVPDLFDEMKGIVDERRIPGRFLILGSTEFSHETQIRESLTGRLSRIRLFPLSLAETKKLELNSEKKFPFLSKNIRVDRPELFKYLERGGFPGIFVVKNDSERSRLIEDWIKLTCERDLHQIKKYKLDSSLAYNILSMLVTVAEPSALSIARELRVSTLKVQNHLNALKTLFVIFEVRPFKGSAGKSLYYLTDTALVTFFEGSIERKMLTWLYLELMSQLSYKEMTPNQIYYYRSKTSSPIHFIFEEGKHLHAVKLVLSESYDERDFHIFNSLTKKNESEYRSISCTGLYGGKTLLKLSSHTIAPWEQIV